MAAPLNTRTTIEQRGVVRFLWAKRYGSKVYPQRNAAHVRWTLLVKSSSSLNQSLSGECLPDDDALERAVCSWFRQQPQELYAADFQRLVKWLDKCLNFLEVILKNKCCLYVIIPIPFFSTTICNFLIDFPS